MTNKEIAELFAAQFDPPLSICHVHNVNSKPVKDAWMAAYWDGARRMGITAHAVDGRLHAFLECEGEGIAEPAGQMMAKALGLAKT